MDNCVFGQEKGIVELNCGCFGFISSAESRRFLEAWR